MSFGQGGKMEFSSTKLGKKRNGTLYQAFKASNATLGGEFIVSDVLVGHGYDSMGQSRAAPVTVFEKGENVCTDRLFLLLVCLVPWAIR